MVIGGVAVIAHGVRRLTTDVDAVVRGDAITAEALIDVFARHGIEPPELLLAFERLAARARM